MAFTPCPCMSLQMGVKILAVVDFVLGVLTLIFSILSIVAVFVAVSEVDNHPQATLFIVMAIFFLIVVLVQLALAVLLYTGAHNRIHKRCQVWLIITLILTVFFVVNIFTAADIVVSLVRLLYTIYEAVVVVFFMKELKAENGSHNQIE